MRALIARARRDERGATAIFVALCFTILFGFVAIAIDIGDVVQERRELQNGADSAALAVAKDCTTKPTCGAATATADTYADQNAADGQHTIDEVCGNGAGLSGCSGPPTLPAGASGYVRVRTSTNDPEGGDQIEHRFAPVLSDAFVGKTVHASAVAAWGAPAEAAVLPLAMSVCEFNGATANGTTFAPPTGGTPPYSGPQRVIKFHGDTGTPQCPAGPAGKNVPGGWGYLETSSGCSVNVDAGGFADSETGNDPPKSPCTPSMFLNKVVLVPIWDDALGSGNNARYHIKGFAAFYISGFRLGGNGSIWTSNPPVGCSSSERCIGGWFVKFVAPGDVFGGPNLGVVIVRMIA
jgi:Flp pilus assembly pilin Flp